MSEMIEYLLVSPIFFFIVAVAFRLLDNSASIFLNHEILVDSSYVSGELIKDHIENADDKVLVKSLKKALIFRKLHNLFMTLTVVSLILVIIAFLLFSPSI